jgi:hypothetical protein
MNAATSRPPSSHQASAIHHCSMKKARDSMKVKQAATIIMTPAAIAVARFAVRGIGCMKGEGM